MLVPSWLDRLTVLAEPQLWQPDIWEPERRSKSIAFLGKDEQTEEEEGEEEVEVQEGSETKKAILNVSDKDSPYALIDKYFPERESYFYQNRNKFLQEFSEEDQHIGNLHPNEVSSVLQWSSFHDLLNSVITSYALCYLCQGYRIYFQFKSISDH